MNRKELLKSEGYWIAKLQTGLYRELISFMKKTHKNSSQLAEYLGCSKGYISQLLNGNFDHKLSKLVKLSLAIGKAPIIEYKDISEYILEDDKMFSSTASTYGYKTPTFLAPQNPFRCIA
ncbi:MAG: helix-turn-helix transcriptional regulator [Bacteroidales bacterium]|nr:helix-turn-helix transcriptional regulator [Bacteroidales bacterium]